MTIFLDKIENFPLTDQFSEEFDGRFQKKKSMKGKVSRKIVRMERTNKNTMEIALSLKHESAIFLKEFDVQRVNK